MAPHPPSFKDIASVNRSKMGVPVTLFLPRDSILLLFSSFISVHVKSYFAYNFYMLVFQWVNSHGKNILTANLYSHVTL